MITQRTSKQATVPNFMARYGYSPVTPLVVSVAPARDEIDEEYEAWKRENGLDQPLTAQQIEDIYTYELAVM